MKFCSKYLHQLIEVSLKTLSKSEYLQTIIHANDEKILNEKYNYKFFEILSILKKCEIYNNIDMYGKIQYYNIAFMSSIIFDLYIERFCEITEKDENESKSFESNKILDGTKNITLKMYIHCIAIISLSVKFYKPEYEEKFMKQLMEMNTNYQLTIFGPYQYS
ncbi:hypothetical protein A3Q56_05944 [Intoshia linei]|uniref:Uncharacterized protein n=1 Tax=Intoshia linei TaxID=1819745 RepID=A0A177AWV4_9BILA|nr:hypothetical protein A3Q56_05944 [Intoshia linei]